MYAWPTALGDTSTAGIVQQHPQCPHPVKAADCFVATLYLSLVNITTDNAVTLRIHVLLYPVLHYYPEV